MNNTIIRNFNNIVKQNDTVYFLGDLFDSKDADYCYLEKIFKEDLNLENIKIYILLGNHDNLPFSKYFDLGFSGVFNLAYIMPDSEFVLTHDPAICQGKNRKYICGHVHNLFKSVYNKKDNRFVYNVSLEVNDYCLVSLSDIIKEYNKNL